MRGIIVLAAALASVPGWAARSHFVFEERAGKSYAEGEAHWRDALLRASVGGCKERLPPGSRLRPRIRDCVVNQVHVTNVSAQPLVCHVVLEFHSPDDDGRTRVEQTFHLEPYRERWASTAYGPSTLVPIRYVTRCEIAKIQASRGNAANPVRA
jgi:hypothetical protein